MAAASSNRFGGHRLLRLIRARGHLRGLRLGSRGKDSGEGQREENGGQRAAEIRAGKHGASTIAREERTLTLALATRQARSRAPVASLQRDRPIDLDARPSLALAVRPFDDHRIDASGRHGPEPEVDARVARRQITSVGADTPPQRRLSAPLDADSRAEAPAVARLIEADRQPAAAVTLRAGAHRASFNSSRTGPLLFVTSTSTSPSLSTSPNAAPRPTSDSLNAGPAAVVISTNFPPSPCLNN